VDALKCPVCGTESLVTVLSRDHEGGGWRKQTALALASLLLAGGVLWQRAVRKGDASPPLDRK
jgi:hypothetical protein